MLGNISEIDFEIFPGESEAVDKLIRPKKVNRERQCLSELGASITASGGFYFKIPDLPHFAGAKFRFDLFKPSDAILLFAGIPALIEAKCITSFKGIYLSSVRESQVKGMDDWVRAGGRAFLFIFYWQSKTAAAKLGGKPAPRRLYILDWSEFRRKGSALTKAELFSLPYIQRHSIKTESGNYVGRFNVDEWLISLVMG